MIIDGKRAKNRHFNITLKVADKNDPSKSMDYNPRTIASQVLLSALASKSIKSHFVQLGSHLTKEERKLLGSDPKDGGIVRLNKDGFIPIEYTNPVTCAMYYDYATIDDMLSKCTLSLPGDYGKLIMVKDASADTRTLIRTEWCIYRYIGNHSNNDIRSYQRIISKGDMDVALEWNKLDHHIQSKAEDIDSMVKLNHMHLNTDVLDELGTDDKGNLYFHGTRIIRRDEFHGFIETEDPTLSNIFNGDMALRITSRKNHEEIPTKQIKHVTPITTLEGNCDRKFKADIEVTTGYPLITNAVTSMKEFYSGCINLTYIPYYDTSHCQYFDNFAKDCTSLKTVAPISFASAISLESFAEGSTVETYGGDIVSDTAVKALRMFYNCKNLKYINNISLPACFDVSSMFENSGIISTNDTINIHYASNTNRMFAGCKSLTSIYYIDTASAKTMNQMFMNDINLTFINYIDFSSCTSANDIFAGCSKLGMVNIKPKSLHIDLSFKGTALTLAAFRNIISGLDPKTPHTIDITDTPALRFYTAEDATNLAKTGWKIKIN